MNILIFADTYLPKIDGVGISIDHFTRLLAARGHRFVICAPRYGSDDVDQIGDNIHIIRFKNASLPSYPDIKIVVPSQKRISKAFELCKPDLVHIQTPGLLGQYGVLAAKTYGVPLIGTYHTLVSEQDTYISPYRLLRLDRLLNYFRTNKKVKKRLSKIELPESKGLKSKLILKLCNSLYETGSLIITPSRMIKETLLSQGVEVPIEVVSNGMDLQEFTGKVKDAPGNAPRFLHVGRISYEKNCEVILKAFALILEKKPEATLDIVGDGPALTTLKIEANQLGIRDRVNFTGFLSHNDLPKLYPQYDAFLTASTMETQGLVILEAMACGLPCVGVAAYALPELILHEQNGFIAQPFDHVAIANYALRLIGDGELYRRFSATCLETVKDHELGACADKLEAVYKKVVADKAV